MNSSSYFFLRETDSNNYVQLGFPDQSFSALNRTSNLLPKEPSFQFTFKVITSAGKDASKLFIGDLVEISVVINKNTKFVPFIKYVNNAIVFFQNQTENVWQTVITTADAYCDSKSDPTCKNPIDPQKDWGKPLCLGTKVFLMQTQRLNPSNLPAGYWVNYTENGASTYVFSTKDNIPNSSLTSFYIIPIDIQICSGQTCVPFTDFTKYNVSCDKACNCIDDQNNSVFDSSGNCTCGNPPSETSYACCPGKACIKLDNNNGISQSACSTLCKSDTLFDCNNNGYCIPASNGKYKNDPTCGGNCKALTSCGKSSNSKSSLLVGLIVFVVIIVAGIFIWRHFRKKK